MATTNEEHGMIDNGDLFDSKPDDSEPVTRGDLRRIIERIDRAFTDAERSRRWELLVIVAGTTTLNHVQLPPVAGYIGGAAVVALGAVKLLVARS